MIKILLKYFLRKQTVLFFLIITGLAAAQNFNTDVNKEFEKAIGLFKAKNYDTALSVFQRVVNYPSPNSKLTAAEFFIIKIYQQKKDYSESEKSAKSFLSKYPSSKYADEVKKILIQSYIDLKDYYNAFKSSISFLDKSNSIVFRNETKYVAEKLALNYLKSSDVIGLAKDYSNANTKPFLLLLSGKLLRNEGDEKSAVKMFDEIIFGYKNSDEFIEAQNLKKSSNNVESNLNTPLVGVILSLTDQNGIKIQSATEILEGIKFAFHEYNSAHQEKFGLLINDIQKDKRTIVEKSNALIENDNVRCVLGPVFSDDVRNVLMEFRHSYLCIISPTATDDDLVSLNENFYQANPSFSARGKYFAQYLYFVEGVKNVAVLNSIDGYSPLLAASFTQEFERLGGDVVVKETYKSKSYSLADQISRISTFAGSLDGIYAPLSDQNDAAVILSSMVQSGLSLKIFGSQDWFIAKGFETSPELSNKLVFESDYFINYSDPDFKNFSANFKKQTGTEVNRNNLYGYDLAKYIITVMRNINPTRKNIKYKIESGINVTGFHNNISFDYDRINKFINIVRFKDGIFNLVEKFRSGK